MTHEPVLLVDGHFSPGQQIHRTATPYRHGDGFAMKGTLFYNSKPKETFEAYGATIPAAEVAARAKAEEIWRRVKTARPGTKPKL